LMPFIPFTFPLRKCWSWSRNNTHKNRVNKEVTGMIEVKNIRKKFGRKKVLKDVSFTADKGEITCIVGINGVGKTTILNAIMALTPINSGQILIDDKKIDKNSYEKITFIPDANTMLASMRISEAMDFMNDFYNSWNQERATELLGFL